MSDLRQSLKQSVVNRKAMERKLGCVPLSILKLGRGNLTGQMFVYQHERPHTNVSRTDGFQERNKRLLEAGYWKKDSGSGKTTGRGRGTLSIMAAELVGFFIKYYSRPGEVYIDPFMGQGIQMQVAKLLGLHYYGYDVSEKFFRYIKSIKSKIDDGSTKLEIFCADSRYPDRIPDNIGDFSFHSPPYWDIEDYGDEPGQLGNGTYEDFLEGMKDVAKAWLPKFKDAAWHVVNVNDFRKDAVFYPYHADTIRVFQEAGWRLVDIWVIEGLVGGLPKVFAVNSNMRKVAPKVHEYALVFRKAVAGVESA